MHFPDYLEILKFSGSINLIQKFHVFFMEIFVVVVSFKDRIVFVVLVVFHFVIAALIGFGFLFSKNYGLKAVAIQLKAVTLQNNVVSNLQ